MAARKRTPADAGAMAAGLLVDACGPSPNNSLRMEVVRELALDLGRRLAAIRTRLVTSEGRLASAISRRRHRADNQLRESAARLESLSPLAVLGRGYAVCWNADRTAIIREASATRAGDLVRITLAKGELECDVRNPKT